MMGNFVYDLFYNTDVLLKAWTAAAHASWAARGAPIVVLDILFQLLAIRRLNGSVDLG